MLCLESFLVMHNDTFLQLQDNWICSFINSIEQGCEYILTFQINFLVAWKLYQASHELAEFALHHHLPSEATIKRNKAIYISIWIFSIIVWVFYTSFAASYASKNDRTGLFAFNFGMSVILALLIFMQTTLFFLSFRRIRNVRKHLRSQKNALQIRRAQNLAASFLITLFTLMLLSVLNLYTQGYFTTLAIVSGALTSAVYYILLVLFFVILT